MEVSSSISGRDFPGMRFPHASDLSLLFGPDVRIHESVLRRLSELPIVQGRTLRFADLDNTLVGRGYELSIDDGLRHYRGDSVYPYINSRGGLAWYIRNFHDRAMSRFDNYGDALFGGFTGGHKESIILTAGQVEQQQAKIRANFLHVFPSIITPKAEDKMRKIIEYILKIGYIPGSIEFIDDRIDNFHGMDLALSRVLGIPVHFERAIPDGSRVKIEHVHFSGVKMDLH